MASASGACAARIAFDSSAIGSSAIALRPVPSAADCVIAPDRMPTASPSSNPNTALTAITVARPVTATTRASDDLRQRLFLQAAEKLRAHRVADREQEQVEERPAEQLRQFRPGQNPDRDAGNQGSDDGSESNPLEMEPADERPEQDGEEQAQHGLVVQEERQGFDHWGVWSRAIARVVPEPMRLGVRSCISTFGISRC